MPTRPLLLELSPAAVDAVTAAIVDHLRELANTHLKVEGALDDPPGDRVVDVDGATLAAVVERQRVLGDILDRLRQN